jgi:hypothetical protein
MPGATTLKALPAGPRGAATAAPDRERRQTFVLVSSRGGRFAKVISDSRS